MKVKIKSWLNRYVPAEISAVIVVLIFGLGLDTSFHNPVLTAIGASWGDGFGYYGTIIFRDLRKKFIEHKKITLRIVFKTIRNLILEFGVAEILDTFIVRPFAMYIFPILLNNMVLGLIAGKVTADCIFYIPTIISYELRTKFGKD